MHPQQQSTQAILRIISMADSASRQYDTNLCTDWLLDWAWKMCPSCLSTFSALVQQENDIFLAMK